MTDVKKARELLGKRAESMSDEEVEKVIDHLRILVNIVIDRVVAMIPEERKTLEEKNKIKFLALLNFTFRFCNEA